MSSHAALGVVRAGVAVLKGEPCQNLFEKNDWTLTKFQELA
jgi:hypothetical protein